MDRRRRFKLSGFGVFALICAHAAHSEDGVFTLPSAVGRPLDELGRISIVDIDLALKPMVNGLFDENGKQIRRNLLLGVGDHTMLLTPGTYTVGLRCGDTTSWFERPTKVRVDAGRTYTLWCKNITGLSARVKFKEQSHAEWELSKTTAPTDNTAPQPSASTPDL